MRKLFRYDLIGFLLASRIPNLLIIGTTQYLAALFLTKDFPDKNLTIFSVAFLLLVTSTMMIAAGAYIINDYYDQKIDMINRPDRVVVGTLFRRRLAMIMHLLLTVGGIGIGFLLDIRIGIIHLFSGFSLWYYSNQLRRLPIIGNVVIAFMAGLALLLVTVFLSRHEPLIYLYSFFAMSIVMIREIIKDIEDVKGESAFGCQSIPVIWGVRGAKVFIYLICLAGGTLLVYYLVSMDNLRVKVYFLALLPVFIWFIYKLVLADRKREYSTLRNITNLIILSGLVSMTLI